MKRGATFLISISVGWIGGMFCAELAAHSIVVREKLGIICKRGHLLALIHGQGIYQSDLDRALAEARYCAEMEGTKATDLERQSTLAELTVNVGLGAHAVAEKVSPENTKSELNLLRSQFRDNETWRAALEDTGLSSLSLVQMLRTDLRARQWISNRITRAVDVSEDECRNFYDSHLQDFFVPEQRRVGHLFLAAPPETAPKIVDEKRAMIGWLWARLTAEENFETLAAQNSEDEATKLRGGDLGYFSARRMPPDFVEAAVKLRTDEVSGPIRTRLGFHILKLIDVRPARQRAFNEVRDEIAIELANQKCEAAIEKLIVDLQGETRYLRPL
jgi:PPIC-type PPIASE domain